MQYIYTMNGVSKTVPPKRQIIKDISLSFFPGAKIGLLGLNGAGKSTVLRIMAGVDTDFVGEARPQPGIKVGYLEQEPKLNPEHTVRQAVEEGLGEIFNAQAQLDAIRATQTQEAMLPYQQLGFVSDIYRGAPTTQMALTSQTAPSASPLQTALGLGIAGLGAASGAQRAGLFG